MNILFRSLGGMPVDRSRNSSLTEQCAKLFEQHKTFQLAITPEATRKPNAEWKKGFYYIAQEASVPIIVTVIDYGSKVVDFRTVFTPSGDVESDISEIKSHYEGVTAKHPEKFRLN